MQQNSSYVVPSYPQLEQNQVNQNENNNLNQVPNKLNLNKNTNIKHLLFFSNFCEHSKELLLFLNTNNHINKVELICIDNRFVKDNITYIVLSNQQSMPLPPMINSVPTMCILPNHEILKGSQIVHYFQPIINSIEKEKEKINMEPNPFSMQNETSGSFGVSSDHFSFWDSNDEELSASGSGGTKQMYNYVSINNNNTEQIYTPQEETKQESINLEQIQQQRQNDI